MAETGFWPHGEQGALSLTFDDGMRSHLAIAIPRLEAHDLRGTFYLNPKEGWETRLLPWRAPSAAGHEMGNHTIAHPCSLNIRPDLQRWTLGQMDADIGEAERRMNVLFPGQSRSFAYPCYESDIGRGPTRQSYVPIVAKYFPAARAKGTSIRGNHPLHADLHHLSSWGAEGMTAWEMIGLVEQCLAEGWWGILTFHGINEGHLPVAEAELVSLLGYLVRQQHRVWTAPVADVATHIIRATTG